MVLIKEELKKIKEEVLKMHEIYATLYSKKTY